MSVPQSGSFVAGPGAYGGGMYGATPYAGFGGAYGGYGGYGGGGGGGYATAPSFQQTYSQPLEGSSSFQATYSYPQYGQQQQYGQQYGGMYGGYGYGGMGGMDMNYQLGQLNQFHQMSNLGGYGSGYMPPLGSYGADPVEDKPAATEAPKPVKRAVKKQKSSGCC